MKNNRHNFLCVNLWNFIKIYTNSKMDSEMQATTPTAVLKITTKEDFSLKELI